jgi:ATP-dependent RNA helicase DDX42
VASLFGGMKNKKEQVLKLRSGVHIIVSTPGRLIDMIKNKHAKMDRVSFVVLDEADKMFDMGFGMLFF